MLKQIGGLFFEEVEHGNKKFFRFKSETSRSYGLRFLTLLIILIALIGILFTRLAELTIIKGKYYSELSSGNRVREKKVIAPRGIIYDRDNLPIVRNVPLSSASAEITREYNYGFLFAHALGYIGEINTDEINNLNAKLPTSFSYQPGDYIGKSGIEQYYEDKLRGVNGKELIEVDAKSDFIRNLGKVDPRPGNNINLGISSRLQKVASQSMEGKKGAIIATIPQSGEILILYSSPSFDPNQFIKGEAIEGVLNNADRPLFDRAIGGVYPPGSTFKIVMAIAGLETGAITGATQIEDTGVIQIGPFKFPNWYFNQYGKKEGVLDIVGAIKRSNDIFFYKVGEALGIDRLASWAKKMGLGEKLGIDINGEEKGLVPDTSWKKKVRGENWYLGDTYHIAIGQGDLLVTPLQINAWTNAVANGGKLCKPHLIRDQNEICKDLGIKKETIDLVREGMREACSPGGTGWPLFKFKVQSEKLKVDGIDFLQTEEATISGKPIIEIPTACKTGTAEYGDPKGATHAIFTVFAPVVHPQISVTVIVEGGGEGSNVAAPIAKKILEAWFGG